MGTETEGHVVAYNVAMPRDLYTELHKQAILLGTSFKREFKYHFGLGMYVALNEDDPTSRAFLVLDDEFYYLSVIDRYNPLSDYNSLSLFQGVDPKSRHKVEAPRDITVMIEEDHIPRLDYWARTKGTDLSGITLELLQFSLNLHDLVDMAHELGQRSSVWIKNTGRYMPILH